MVLTMLKTTFVKGKPKEVHYRDIKHFDNQKFRNELELIMGGHINGLNDFEERFSNILDANAPIKKKSTSGKS